MSTAISRRAAFLAWLALWLAFAASVWWMAFPQQLKRACWLAEWPFENGCETAPTGKSEDTPSPVFVEHLQRNIGDGNAYALLTRALWKEQDPRALTLLPLAKGLAPFDAQLLATQAEVGLSNNDWPMAAQALVELVERGKSGARAPLKAVMLTPEARDAVLDQIKPDSRWLNSMVSSFDPKLQPALVQAYIAKGSELGVLQPATVLSMIERLKTSGDWMEAYPLWVSLRGKVKEGLFNPGFDQRALRRGFDWEWPQQAAARQGLRVDQVSAAPRPGMMMEIQMTGRAALPQPMLGQAMLLLGNSYRFRGRYMSDRMRTTDGLVWALRCAAGGDRFAETAPIKDSQRNWLNLDLAFRIPDQCGGVVRLQLEAASPGEARAGMAGDVYFDDFEILPEPMTNTAGTKP